MALAYLVERGIGTSADVDEAEKLISNACQVLHYEPACDLLREPQRHIPPP
jgi:hypothetical protein